MSEGSNNMLKLHEDQARGRALVEAAKAARKARMARDAAGIARMKRAAALPPEAGEAIIPAPARGGFVLLPVDRLERAPDYVMTARGHQRARAVRSEDVFDRMAAQAARRKQSHPLTPGQIGMARRYRALVEMLSADGYSLSCVEAEGISGDGGSWMDRRLELSAEVAMLHDRIGLGAALRIVRRRASDARGVRRTILDRRLIDLVCLQDYALDDVLRRHGWQVDGRGRNALMQALCASLDRMVGYRGA